jgi:hypothetical protein
MSRALEQQVNQATEQEAFSEGLRAGRLRLPAGLSPYPIGSDLHKQWFRGWFSEVGPVITTRRAA